jgi:hypothetical protein
MVLSLTFNFEVSFFLKASCLCRFENLNHSFSPGDVFYPINIRHAQKATVPGGQEWLRKPPSKQDFRSI